MQTSVEGGASSRANWGERSHHLEKGAPIRSPMYLTFRTMFAMGHATFHSFHQRHHFASQLELSILANSCVRSTDDCLFKVLARRRFSY